MNKNHFTSEELMESYKKDSPEIATKAFEILYSRYANRVYGYLINKTHSNQDADELLQKVFLKIHESKHLYDNKYKFEQWIFVIARNSIIDMVRKQKRDLRKIEEILKEAEFRLPIENDESKNLTSDAILLKGLEDDQFSMLELKYVDGFTYKEISGLVNKSEASLRKAISRLVLKVRNGDV